MPARRNDGPMRLSRPMPRATSRDVGADLLADVGDLVDEGDLGREEGVRGELDHLGGGDVGAHDLAAERPVERCDLVGGPLVAGVGADHHPVGVQEVLDRRALLEELRAGDVGEAGQRRGGSPGRCRRGRCSSSPARDRRRPGAARRRPGRARGRRRRSRSAACRRSRRAAARASSTSAISVVKVRRSALRSQELVDARLVDRHLAARERPRSSPRSMSSAITWCPSSAKQAAVTRPTQPTPITPIGVARSCSAVSLAASRLYAFGTVTFCIDSAIPNI